MKTQKRNHTTSSKQVPYLRSGKRRYYSKIHQKASRPERRPNHKDRTITRKPTQTQIGSLLPRTRRATQNRRINPKSPHPTIRIAKILKKNPQTSPWTTTMPEALTKTSAPAATSVFQDYLLRIRGGKSQLNARQP